MRRIAVGAAVVVLVLGALFVVRPFIAAERDMPAEIPSPASLERTDLVPLTHGAPVCFGNAVADHRSEQVRFKIYSPHGPAPALSVHVAGPGYDYTAKIPPGTPDNTLVQAPIPAPPANVPVRVCIRSAGRPPIALFASSDRTRSRSMATVDGKRTIKSVWFSFYEPAPRAITERLPDTIQRMTVFRPHYVTQGVLWVLAVLFLVGMPIAVIWAYARALRDDGLAEGPPVDVRRRRSRWRRWLD
jgi:hypothetical protein